MRATTGQTEEPHAALDRWERLWAPYDQSTYDAVLKQIGPSDHVLEIGAGDLRLSHMVAKRAAKVYALEMDQQLIGSASLALADNIDLLVGDARILPFPTDVTVAVLLMRHCTHFSLYFDKLRDCNCRTLLTNARWGMYVETIDLRAPRHSFAALHMGWFACHCGHRGFKPGPPEQLTARNVNRVWEVDACPACFNARKMDAFSVTRNHSTATAIKG